MLWVNVASTNSGAHTWQIQGRSTVQENVSQPLKAGWNHVSLPLDNPIAIDRYVHGTAIEKIWSYDAANNQWAYWQKHSDDEADTAQTLIANVKPLNTLEPDAIYWVYTQRDQVIAKANGITATRYFLHNNHLGSVAVETDQNGAVAQASLYQPYGSQLQPQSDQGNGLVNPYSFSGKELDGSGLYYFEARFYDPLTTRFISPDPLFATEIEKCVGAINNCNLYQYTLNNPINLVDPQGLAPGKFADGNYWDNDGQENPGWSADIDNAYSQVGAGLSEGWQYHPSIALGTGSLGGLVNENSKLTP